MSYKDFEENSERIASQTSSSIETNWELRNEATQNLSSKSSHHPAKPDNYSKLLQYLKESNQPLCQSEDKTQLQEESMYEDCLKGIMNIFHEEDELTKYNGISKINYYCAQQSQLMIHQQKSYHPSNYYSVNELNSIRSNSDLTHPIYTNTQTLKLTNQFRSNPILSFPRPNRYIINNPNIEPLRNYEELGYITQSPNSNSIKACKPTGLIEFEKKQINTLSKNSFGGLMNNNLIKRSSQDSMLGKLAKSNKVSKDEINEHKLLYETTLFLEAKLKDRKGISIKDFYGYLKDKIKLLISQKESSKLMQKSISLCSSEVLKLICIEIIPGFVESLENNFCAYFYQKLIRYLEQTERLEILLAIRDCIFNLCCSSTGVHLVCALIEKATSNQELYLIIKGLSSRVIQLVSHEHGYRCLLKILKFLEENCFEKVYTHILSNFKYYSLTQSSCEVIKELLILISKNKKQASSFTNAITENLQIIAFCPIGHQILVSALAVRKSY